jgi:hypothetical protein
LEQNVTTTLSESPAVSPPQCWPWCSWRGDHPADDPCFSAECYVDLSLYPEIEDSCDQGPEAAQAFGTGPDQIAVCGSSVTAGGDPRVQIWHNVQPSLRYFQVDLTPGEAGQLIEALQLVLGQIEAGR